VFRAAAHFLVRSDSNAQAAVGDFRMVDQVADGGEYFGDAGFIIGAEQGIAVGGDDVVADLAGQLGRLVRTDDDPGGEVEVAALIIFVNDGPDVSPAHLRGGIHVGDKADDGHRMAGIGGQGGGDVAPFIHAGIGEAHLPEFLDQLAAENFLFFGAGV